MMRSPWLGRWTRRARGCPPGWKITRAVSDQHDLLRAHIEGCPWCATEYQALRDVVDRAGALATTDDVSHEARQKISARLLRGDGRAARAMPSGFRMRPLWLGALGVVSLAVTWGAWTLAGRDGHQRAVGGSTAPARFAGTAAGSGSTPAATRAPRSRASVRAVDAARFTRIAAPPDERILLQEGVIVLDVVPLQHGERFRVVTDDAEVEVRGTHFEVSASGGRLVAVRVASGKVQVRSTAGALATLEAGDEWVGRATNTAVGTNTAGAVADRHAARSASAAGAVTVPRTTGRRDTGGAVSAGGIASTADTTNTEPPTPAGEGPPARSPTQSSPTARVSERARPTTNAHGGDDRRHTPAISASFDRAWSLLRKGDTREAAAAFAEVESAVGGGSLAEDAAYWRGVATARSGDDATARRLFADFLRRFPASARHGEASVALGWILLRAGLRDEARSAFERAAADPSAPVRDNAAEGMRRAGRH